MRSARAWTRRAAALRTTLTPVWGVVAGRSTGAVGGRALAVPRTIGGRIGGVSRCRACGVSVLHWRSSSSSSSSSSGASSGGSTGEWSDGAFDAHHAAGAGEEDVYDDVAELHADDFASIAAELRPGQVLPLEEGELEETFVRGWGKGGQKVNKTTNAVILTHQPTGLQVKVHATRSLQQNRKIARKQLALKVDEVKRGKSSVLGQKAAKKAKQNRKRYQRAKAKYQADAGDGSNDAPKLSAKQKRAERQAKKDKRKGRANARG